MEAVSSSVAWKPAVPALSKAVLQDASTPLIQPGLFEDLETYANDRTHTCVIQSTEQDSHKPRS